eukprot:jgi/Picre1/28753/NNA_004152.t1
MTFYLGGSYYISPGLLELGTKFCKEALAPLQQPGPDAAAFAVSKFQKLCTVKCNGSEKVYNEALLYESEMITFWKPVLQLAMHLEGM